jgi:rod shape-determining protein MreD
MDLSRHRQMIVLSIIALLLQIIVAPNLQIASALPSFITSFVVAYVLVYNQESHYVQAFLMGFAADLLGNSALGLTALCLLIIAFLVGIVGRTIGSDNAIMSIVTMLVALFGSELVYGLFMAGAGAASVGDAMLYRVLPCTLYNTAIAVIWYLILMKRASPLRVGMRMPANGSTKLRFH